MTQQFPFDPYQALELSYGVSDQEIKTQYRKLLKKYHPDYNSDPGAKDKLDRVVQAYRMLSDPAQKRAFDKHREERIFGGYRPNPQTEAILNGLKSFATKVANEYLDNIGKDDFDDIDPHIYDMVDFGARSTKHSHKFSISIPKENILLWQQDPDYWISQVLLLLEIEMRNKINRN